MKAIVLKEAISPRHLLDKHKYMTDQDMKCHLVKLSSYYCLITTLFDETTVEIAHISWLDRMFMR
jgi:hypothetical protein